MQKLVPAAGVEVIEIASPLFTDYAQKQRLLKLPAGKKVMLNGDSLPIFPEGTIIAKTFYYPTARQIIETRLLLLKDHKWNVATYRWDKDQKNATLLTAGAIVPVSLGNRKLAYKIPSQGDCGSCHRSGNEISPIGPKAANLNISVHREGSQQNQLAYLMNKGMIAHADITSIASLPAYSDTTLPVSIRARAYLEINCAHCHQPSGMAANTSVMLGYFTPYDKTGIEFNKQNMLIRMSTMGEFHMPKTGTTIIDAEGLQLVRKYIKDLNSGN
ncbi:hypothetical protein [Chitinophaga sp.]|uniref:hypothetical protein n=1 Tax=Chitinophaga sp. TaxID=1869181 RepID=UPI0031DEB3C5